MNVVKNSITFASLFLAASLLLVSHAAYATAAGRAQFVNGSVQITSAEGQTRVLKKGGAVNEGDTLTSSKAASAQIKMQDGGLIAVRPDTQLKFVSFKFNGEQDGSERSFLSLIRGGFRAITGLIGKINKANYRISTADSSIGIRGTDHETFVVTADSPLATVAAIGTYNKVNRGETSMTTNKGTIFVLPNQMGFAGSADQMPELRPLNTDIFTVADRPTIIAASDENEGKEDGKEARKTPTKNAKQEAAPAAGIASSTEKGDEEDSKEAHESTPVGIVTKKGDSSAFEAASSTDKEDGKYSGKEDSKYSGKEDSKYSGKEDGKYSGKEDGKYSGKEDGKYSGKEDGKYSGRDDGKYSGREDGKYSGREDGRHTGKEVRESAPVDNAATKWAAPAVKVALSMVESVDTYILQRDITTTHGTELIVGNTMPRREVMLSMIDPNAAVLTVLPVLGFYVNAPARMMTDVAGNLTKFDINTINNAATDDASISVTSGTSGLANAGNDPLTGISWGRWDGGIVNVTDRTTGAVTTQVLSGSLHWIAGQTEIAAVTLPTTGTYTYINAGGTAPTDNLGAVGTLNNATLVADFTAQTVQIGVNVTVGGATMDAAAMNVPIIQKSDFYADSQAPLSNPEHLTVKCSGTCGTSQQGNILGGFSGTGATGAMMTYGLQNISATTTQVISGVAAFRK